MGAGLLVVVVVGIVGVVAASYFPGAIRPGPIPDDRRLVARVSEAPKVRIADAEEGALVRIVGVIEPLDATLTAPLSGREVVGYESRVTDPTTGGVFSRETRAVAFIVCDGARRARVEASGASLLLVLRPVTAKNAELRDYLARRRLTGRATVAEEGVLVAGSEVAVVGRAFWPSGTRPATNETYRGPGDEPRGVTITAHGADPVIVTDVGDLLG